VFTALLHSNGRGTHHRWHRFQQYLYCSSGFVAAEMFLLSRCLETAVVHLLISRSLHSNGCTCYNNVRNLYLSYYYISIVVKAECDMEQPCAAVQELFCDPSVMMTCRHPSCIFLARGFPDITFLHEDLHVMGHRD
jgi:hypothetical protein